MAQTEAGRSTLADWLKAPADVAQVAWRQGAVRELSGMLALREQMWECGHQVEQEVQRDRLTAWISAPARAASPLVRGAALLLGLSAIPAAWCVLSAWLLPALAIFGAQAAFAMTYRKLTEEVSQRAAHRARELQTVASLVERVERARFACPALQELQQELHGELLARRRVRRLIWLVEWMDARRNPYFAMVSAPLLLGTQLALAIESWRTQHASMISRWVAAVATLEALSCLATYSYEHPENVFPELLADAPRPRLSAQGLGHPLLPTATMVRNDVALGEVQLLLITGSNMSGKSTLLRAVGANAVLAFAGAPVCARAMTLTPLAIGGTIRTSDSLQEGVSRFFAEIRRIRGVVGLAERSPFTLFLLDEILAGTNSHDRQQGGEAIVRALLDHGAIGLVTTHDLSLAQLAESLQPRARNAHFEDLLKDDRLVFDFTLRPGIVNRSNALDLMRLVGLKV